MVDSPRCVAGADASRGEMDDGGPTGNRNCCALLALFEPGGEKQVDGSRMRKLRPTDSTRTLITGLEPRNLSHGA